MKVSLDGGETYQPAPEGVRIIVEATPHTTPGGLSRRELHANFTHEGLILDVWEDDDGDLWNNIGTRADMVDDIVNRLI